MSDNKREELMYRAPIGILGVFILILGVLAFPGLSAFSGIGGNNAGQGAEVVDGFIVDNIGYDAKPSSNDPDASILQVSFDIERDGTGRDIVNYTNAGVFVQLRSDSYLSEWAKCFVLDGYAECYLEEQAQMDVVDITGISVVAFDSEADNIPFVATGGDLVYDITVNSINYRVHEFQTVGTSTFNVESISLIPRVEYVIVAGGGAGGSGWAGGGGGAGGVSTGAFVATEGQYSVTVGGGGWATGNQGAPGQESVAFGKVVPGGGGGAGRNGDGQTGASGGGGGWEFNVSGADRGGGGFIPGFGFGGGTGRTEASVSRGGGGGGFTGAGGDYGATSAGNGGNGFTTSITGSVRCLAGGGGGGAESESHTRGTATCGGGGGGQANSIGASSGGSNTGGGGGGGAGSSSALGGSGAAGTVIVRYRLN